MSDYFGSQHEDSQGNWQRPFPPVIDHELISTELTQDQQIRTWVLDAYSRIHASQKYIETDRFLSEVSLMEDYVRNGLKDSSGD
jgi:hypothetical protein